MKDADQLIAGALRDIAAEAGPPRPLADAAWRAGRRRRVAVPVASAALIAGVIALALTLVLPQAPAPGPTAPPPSTRLVSITLSAGPAAGTSVLDAAAHLLQQRAAYLRLPDTQIQIIGPNVVLTGPAADQAQLKTIAMPGVLDFRQVLLYQKYRGPTYGNSSLVSGQTLALFGRLACTPGNTGTWKSQAGYTAADYDNPYVQVVACDGSGNKYALDVAMVRGTQLSSAVAAPSPTSVRWTVLLTLNSAGTTAFAALTAQLYDTYFAAAQAGHQNDLWLDSVGMVVDGNVVAAPEILGPIPGGHLQLPGAFTRAQAEALAAQLHFGALPSAFRITAVSTSAAP